MKSPRRFFGWTLGFAVVAAALHAETVPDRKAAVLKDRATLQFDPRWIYNDFEKGFARGRETGKPVLIVLRCIPCLACSGIDAKVLLENTELTPLLDQFICVRVIDANRLELAKFQFDFDLSFTTMIFNGDGTLYGRYGSWTHQKNPQEQTTDGFRRALESALAIHKGYPGNKGQLAGKQARPAKFATPIDMPTLNGKYSRNLDWEGKVVQSCVHCHQIGDALRADYRQRKEKIPSQLVYPFPAPETIGIELAADQPARVKVVRAGSPAAAAGLKVGDDIVKLGGQPLISAADFSWVLHQAPDAGSLTATVQRGGERSELTVKLPESWRYQSDISRRVGTWGMRAMALGGLLLEDLPEDARARRGLTNQQLALFAKHVGEYGEHAAAKKAGFQKEDVIVELGGSSARVTESELIGRLLKNHQPGDQVKTVVLRGDQRVELMLPIQ